MKIKKIVGILLVIAMFATITSMKAISGIEIEKENNLDSDISVEDVEDYEK